MDDDTMLVAKLFRGFSDPTRLAILRRLADAPARVTDLVDHLGCSQANVSGHLACLRDCGLVHAHPEGRAVRYRLTGDHVVAVIRSAEALLAEQGTHADLCRNYDPDEHVHASMGIAVAMNPSQAAQLMIERLG